MLTGQVTTLRSKWSNATNDNMRLQAEVGTLRKTLQVFLPGSQRTSLLILCTSSFCRPCGHPVQDLNKGGLSAITSPGKSFSRGSIVRTPV